MAVAVEATIHWILTLLALLMASEGRNAQGALEIRLQVYEGDAHVYDLRLEESEDEDVLVYRIGDEGEEQVGVFSEGEEPGTVTYREADDFEATLDLRAVFTPEAIEGLEALDDPEGAEFELVVREEAYQVRSREGVLEIEQGGVRIVAAGEDED